MNDTRRPRDEEDATTKRIRRAAYEDAKRDGLLELGRVRDRLDELLVFERNISKVDKLVRQLVLNVGDRARCHSQSCRQEIYWVRHANGKKCPYDSDGTPHFATCPAAKHFKR